MKLYIDSADVASWRLPPGAPRVAGVTTNPSLVHQAGLSVDLAGYRVLINEAAAHDFSEVMLQVPTSDAAENAQLVASLYFTIPHHTVGKSNKNMLPNLVYGLQRNGMHNG